MGEIIPFPLKSTIKVSEDPYSLEAFDAWLKQYQERIEREASFTHLFEEDHGPEIA